MLQALWLVGIDEIVFLSKLTIAIDENVESEKEKKRRERPIYTKSSIGVVWPRLPC